MASSRSLDAPSGSSSSRSRSPSFNSPQGSSHAVPSSYRTFIPSFSRNNRPGTSSTTASFTSASASPNSSRPGSPVLGSSSTSSTSTYGPASNGTHGPGTGVGRRGSTRIGKSFEALLASDETYVLRETHDLAQDERDEERERTMLTTSGSNSSSSRRVLLGRKSRWEESEDGGERQTFVDVATGSAESAGLRQGRDEDLRSQRSTDAGSRALPSDGATPRQSSSARMPSSSTSQSASGSTAAHSLQPARPPKAVDRSPSGSTYSSSMTSNARYATPPSGGASPAAGGSTPLPDVTDNIPNGPDDDDDDIPNGSNPKRISYLRAGGTASSPDLKTLVSKKSQMAQANAVGEPPSNEHHSSSSAGTARRAEPRSSSSVEQASSPPPLAGPQYYSPVPQRPEKSRTQSAATMSASSRPRSRTTGGPDNQGRASKEQSNAPPLPFPRGSTVQEGAEVADDGRYNSQAGSLGSRGSAVSPSSRDREPVGLPESVSLAEEIAQGSPQPETHSSGAFKERMKKTSGFLKKLRGDSSKEEKRERERAEKARTAAAKAKSLGKANSQSSFNSESGVSVAASIKSTTSVQTSTGAPREFGASKVPVPSIPSKYARQPSQDRRRDEFGPSPVRTEKSAARLEGAQVQPPAALRDGDGASRPSVPVGRTDVDSASSRYNQAARGEVSSNPSIVEPRNELGPPTQVPIGRGPAPSAGLRAPVIIQRSPSAPNQLQPVDRSAKEANALPTPNPQRKSSLRVHTRKPSSAGESSDTGSMKNALRAWESDLDAALRDSAKDLDKKTEFKPNTSWLNPSPSPRLPDLILGRDRTGAFMEDDDLSTGLTVPLHGTASLPTTPTPSSNGLAEQQNLSVKRGASLPHHGSQFSTPTMTPSRTSSKSPLLAPEPHSPGERPATGLGIGLPRNSDYRGEMIHSDPITQAEVLTSSGNIVDPRTRKMRPPNINSSVPYRELGRSAHMFVPPRTSSSPQAGGSATMSESTNSIPMPIPESPHSVQTPRSSSRGNSTDSALPSPDLHRREAISGASLTSVKSFETAAESTGKRRSALSERGIEQAGSMNENVESSAHKRPTSMIEDSQRGAFSGLSEAEATLDEEIDPEQSIRLIPHSGASDNGEAITPTDINALELMPSSDGSTYYGSNVSRSGTGLETITEGTHSREPSTVSSPPLVPPKLAASREPSPGPSVGSSGRYLLDRRGSRHSVQSLPTHSLSGPSGYASNNGPQATLSSVSSVRNPSSTDTSSIGGDETAEGLEERAKELAQRCWVEDESFLRKEKVAEWLGGVGRVNKAAREAYFAHFDFKGLRVDSAFRKLCDKLFLRAETQQVDRILNAFSQRYWDCNRASIYGSADVVHSIVFSLLLLNTDLHVADISDRMTRNQFVRNTMAAIQEQRLSDIGSPAIPADDSRSSLSGIADTSLDSGFAPSASVGLSTRTRPSRSGSIQSYKSLPREPVGSTPNLHAPSDHSLQELPSPSGSARPPPSVITAREQRRRSGSLTELSARMHTRWWENEVETLLKDIYVAVKNDQIRLPTSDSQSRSLAGLSPNPSMGRSRLAKGPGTPSLGSDRVAALKRGSIRGIQGLLGSSNSALYSDGTTSPTLSTNTSRSFGESWQQTPGSSLASSSGSQLAPSLGFAGTLSQSIIKESQDEDAPSLNSTAEEPDDDELALMGPPWAKEGVLARKHYWEAPQKRAKDKAWTEVFVVVQKGMLSMFRFGETSSAAKGNAAASGAMGGGNWLSNATQLGEVSLAHTLANALPPPGYNRSRPHVFALTLPGGAVYFFQAGHEDLVHEWVSTCNYWAARQSREPLSGGVSNMEYGWNKVLPSDSYEEELASLSGAGSLHSISISSPPDASIYASGGTKPGDARSVRSGRSGRSMRARYQNWADAASLVTPNGPGSSTASALNVSVGGSGHSMMSPAPSILGGQGGHSNPNDRIFINEWKAPAPPTVPSTLKEEEQLERCQKHMEHIEAELVEHNDLRTPMLQLYSMRSSNYSKALANWERKSNSLLQELVKYQCYVESLKNAVRLRAEKRDMREVDSMMRRADEEMARVREAEEGGPLRA